MSNVFSPHSTKPKGWVCGSLLCIIKRIGQRFERNPQQTWLQEPRAHSPVCYPKTKSLTVNYRDKSLRTGTIAFRASTYSLKAFPVEIMSPWTRATVPVTGIAFTRLTLVRNYSLMRFFSIVTTRRAYQGQSSRIDVHICFKKVNDILCVRGCQSRRCLNSITGD